MATRTAHISGTVQWSDGSNFNGYALFILQYPTTGGTAWPAVQATDKRVTQTIPPLFPVPVKNGTFNTEATLPYNADLNPPGTLYAAWYFDSGRRQINATPTAANFFAVTADPVTPTIPALTVPTAPTVVNNSPEN